jgi:hypothetical protein
MPEERCISKTVATEALTHLPGYLCRAGYLALLRRG